MKFMKLFKRKEEADNNTKNSKLIFDKDAEEKRYKRYEYMQYCKLVIKSALTFILGLLFAAMLKLAK